MRKNFIFAVGVLSVCAFLLFNMFGIHETNVFAASGSSSESSFSSLSGSKLTSVLNGTLAKKAIEEQYSNLVKAPKANLRAISITANTTLSANKTYNSNVVIAKNMTLNLNHKTMIVYGNLTIKGILDVSGGVLKVYGDLSISQGMLDVHSGSVTIYKSSSISDDGNFVNAAGILSMQASADKVTVTNGSFLAEGQDSEGYLRAGTIDINGNFVQMGAYSYSSFAPDPTLKVILRGTTAAPRTVLFDTPVSSYFTNYQFVSGTTFSSSSVISIRKELTAAFTISAPQAAVYYCGSLNGQTLTANCGIFMTTPSSVLNFNGGKVIANCPSGFGEYSYIMMTNANDRFYSKGNFITASHSSSQLSAGLLEVGGDFRQIGTSMYYDGDTFAPESGFTVKFDKVGAKVSFDDPDYSYFTNLVLKSGAYFTSDSVIPLKLSLLKDTVINDYPNLRLTGGLNGKTLTVNCSFTIGWSGLNIQGGKLYAKGDVTGAGGLNMTASADYVRFYHDYTIPSIAYGRDMTAGTLELDGNLTVAVPSEEISYPAFAASGTHKTILRGTGKKVSFGAPDKTYFADVAIVAGSTFTADSVISVNCSLTHDMSLNAPNVYFTGNLNGHTMTTSGNMVVSDIFLEKGQLNVGKNLTNLHGCIYMYDPEDTISVGGDFLAQGTGCGIMDGKIFVKGDFTQSSVYSKQSFSADSKSETILCGVGTQVITFDNGSADMSKFGILYLANPQVEYDKDKIYYTKLIQSYAFLSSITVDGGTLRPVFLANKLGYIAVVPKGVVSATLHAVKADESSTVKINGVAADSKLISAIPYNSATTVPVTVLTYQNLFSRTYTVKLEQLNADLKGIGLSVGSLSVPFSANTLAYTVELPAGSDSIVVAPSIDNPDSSFTIQGLAVSSVKVDLLPGVTKTVTISVTGQDGVTTKDYVVTVHRAPLLDGINITNGTLSPAFSYQTDQYTLVLPASVASTTIKPVKSAGCGVLTVNGVQTAAQTLTLNDPGASQVVTIVASESGSTLTHTYTVTVKRNAILTGLGQSAGTLSPDYSATTHSYTLVLPGSASSVKLTPVKGSDCTGLSMASGTNALAAMTSITVNLEIGQTIPVTIRAQAGSVSQTYTIQVSRKPVVTGIWIDGSTFTPAFSPSVKSYEAVLPACLDFSPIWMTAMGSDDSTVYIDNTANGNNVEVTVLPGASHTYSVVGKCGSYSVTYTVHLVRTKPLTNIATSVAMDSAFDPQNSGYLIWLPSNVNSVTIKVTKSSTCGKVIINGKVCTSLAVSPSHTSRTEYLIEATDLATGVISKYHIYINPN